MKKFWIQVTFLIVIILGSLYISFRSDLRQLPIPGPHSSQQRRIKINDVVIKVDVADTPQLRSRGLGGKDSLPLDQSMLFVFPEAKKYQFWMKGVKFPLDMIFIADAKIVDIIKNVPTVPNGTNDEGIIRYQSIIPVNMVLEVNAGFVDRHSIKIGDNVYEIKQGSN